MPLLCSSPALLIRLAIVCLALSPLAPAPAQTAAASAPPKPSLTVSAATVQRLQWSTTLQAAGAVAAWQDAVISARSNGLPLTEVLADVGSVVRKGQLLARFDDRSVRAELAQAEATLAQEQASARQALANRDRTLGLKASGAVSEQDELQDVTQADTAVAKQANAAAALASARVKLENTRVVAPDAGVVSARSATLGQVAASGTELFRLIRQNRLEWRAEVPAQQAGAVRPGMSIQVSLPDGSTVRGAVRQVAPTLDAASRLALVYADLPPGHGGMASMYLRGQIELGVQPALVVPGESVVIRDGRSYVFRLDGPRVQRVAVTTGRRQDNLVEITQGLQAGQRVALRGAGFLSDGDTVQVAEPVARNQP
jgi:RND family efflux transporter MFP subunit